MLTLFHAPMSRSTRVHILLEELGIRDQTQIEVVSIRRGDGSGGADPRNPHPEGKVPLLIDDGVAIRESVAIMQYLADKFPEAGLNIPQGDRLRGPYLSWFAWYAGVLEPLIDFHLLGIKHPGLEATFRSLDLAMSRLIETLDSGPWLVGDHYTAVDLLLESVFSWQPSLTPDNAAVKDWLARCHARPAIGKVMADEIRLMKAA